MANGISKKRAFEQIRENISRTGHHIYVVSGAPTPRFAYSIGLSEAIGVELVFGGAVLYFSEEVTKIVNDLAARLKAERDRRRFEIVGYGSFTLRKVHSTWAKELMLGAFDYYKKRDIPALQIVPDKSHWTIDVPDMSVLWSAATEPVWRWLSEAWTYPVPQDSTAATNLAALRGDRVTEVMRWDEDEWETFAEAGPDVAKEDMRVVPLGTLIASDKSLEPAVHLRIGEGLWRDPDPNAQWDSWRKRENASGN